jgi:hypothetical protein
LLKVALAGCCDKRQEQLNGRTATSHCIGPATSAILIPQISLSIFPAQKLLARKLVQQTLKPLLAALLVFRVNIRLLDSARLRLNLGLYGVIEERNFTEITKIYTLTWFK